MAIIISIVNNPLSELWFHFSTFGHDRIFSLPLPSPFSVWLIGGLHRLAPPSCSRPLSLHMIGPPPAVAATTSASSHKPRQSAPTFPSTSRRSSGSLLGTSCATYGTKLNRYVALFCPFFVPGLKSFPFVAHSWLKHLSARWSRSAGTTSSFLGDFFLSPCLPLGSYLYWALSNCYLFCCEDILRFVSYLLCVSTCVCMCVWEDRDLTYTDPAPLKSARWEYGSHWAGCVLSDSEMTETDFWEWNQLTRFWGALGDVCKDENASRRKWISRKRAVLSRCSRGGFTFLTSHHMSKNPIFFLLFFLRDRVAHPLSTFINPYVVWKVLLDGPGRKQLVHGQARSVQQPRVAGWADVSARWQQEGRTHLRWSSDSSERPRRAGAPPPGRQITTLLCSLWTPQQHPDRRRGHPAVYGFRPGRQTGPPWWSAQDRPAGRSHRHVPNTGHRRRTEPDWIWFLLWWLHALQPQLPRVRPQLQGGFHDTESLLPAGRRLYAAQSRCLQPLGVVTVHHGEPIIQHREPTRLQPIPLPS